MSAARSVSYEDAVLDDDVGNVSILLLSVLRQTAVVAAVVLRPSPCRVPGKL